jgi:nitrite reductase (NO-forming)
MYLSRRTLLAFSVLAVVFVAASLTSAVPRADHVPARTGAVEAHVYGMPAAEVFQETYDGPPVTGDIATFLPHVARLSPGNRTHHVRVDVVVQQIEVAPGVRYDAWTFGGTVPGPVLHVREGDLVVFTMKNRSSEMVPVSEPMQEAAPFFRQVADSGQPSGTRATLAMPHSIDFHAAMMAPDDKYRMIKPGDSIRFQWVANYPGVYMYHCGTPPVLAHVAMGQYGIVIVSPKEGYPTDGQVAREYAVVQSEFYLKAGSGETHVLDMDAARRKMPSHVVFNGHVNALKDRPLIADAGDRIRLYVHNFGPNDTASTHVVGTIFDRVWYEGNPANAWRGMQTVLLGASNGAVVEFVLPEAGEYLLVDHEFADAQKGAVGLIRAGSKTGELPRHTPPMSH